MEIGVYLNVGGGEEYCKITFQVIHKDLICWSCESIVKYSSLDKTHLWPQTFVSAPSTDGAKKAVRSRKRRKTRYLAIVGHSQGPTRGGQQPPEEVIAIGIHRGNQSLVAAGLYAWQDVPLHRDVKCKVYHGCTIRRAVALSPNMGYMAHYGTDSQIPIHRCCTNMMASHFRKILSFGSYLHGLTGQYLADLSIPSKNLFESFIPEQQCAT